MTQETKIEPRSKALAYELMGVLAYVAERYWDDECRVSVEYVMRELLAGNAGLAMPEDVSKLVKKLREGQEYDYYGNDVSPDYVMGKAADALEAAYGVTAKDKQC